MNHPEPFLERSLTDKRMIQEGGMEQTTIFGTDPYKLVRKVDPHTSKDAARGVNTARWEKRRALRRARLHTRRCAARYSENLRVCFLLDGDGAV